MIIETHFSWWSLLSFFFKKKKINFLSQMFTCDFETTFMQERLALPGMSVQGQEIPAYYDPWVKGYVTEERIQSCRNQPGDDPFANEQQLFIFWQQEQEPTNRNAPKVVRSGVMICKAYYNYLLRVSGKANPSETTGDTVMPPLILSLEWKMANLANYKDFNKQESSTGVSSADWLLRIPTLSFMNVVSGTDTYSPLS